MARIDAPLLDSVNITLLYEETFNVSQLGEFMRRTASFKTPDEAHLNFDDSGVLVKFLPRAGAFGEGSMLRISCRVLEWQLSSLVQCSLLSARSLAPILGMNSTPQNIR